MFTYLNALTGQRQLGQGQSVEAKSDLYMKTWYMVDDAVQALHPNRGINHVRKTDKNRIVLRIDVS